MAQIIKTICDIHYDQDEEVPGEQYTITLNGRTVEIDLCDEDAKELLDVWAVLVGHGRVDRRERRRPNGSPAVCPICKERFARPQGLGAHKRFAHPNWREDAG